MDANSCQHLKSDLVWLDDFSIIRTSMITDFELQPIIKKMLRPLKYLFGAGLVLVANPGVILADPAVAAVSEEAGKTTTSLIKTISNAFQTGDAAAQAQAHRELWDLGGQCDFHRRCNVHCLPVCVLPWSTDWRDGHQTRR